MPKEKIERWGIMNLSGVYFQLVKFANLVRMPLLIFLLFNLQGKPIFSFIGVVRNIDKILAFFDPHAPYVDIFKSQLLIHCGPPPLVNVV